MMMRMMMQVALTALVIACVSFVIVEFRPLPGAECGEVRHG